MEVKNDVRTIQLAFEEKLLDVEELERRQTPDITIITIGPPLRMEH